MVLTWIKAFIACACLGFLMCLVLFFCHLAGMSIHVTRYLGVLTSLAGRSMGVCLYTFWAGLGCLMCFVNSTVWADNVENRSPVWCDISKSFIYQDTTCTDVALNAASRLIIALNVAIPISSNCIMRQVYRISRGKITMADEHHNAITDLCLGLGIPVLDMILCEPLSFLRSQHFPIASPRLRCPGAQV